MYFRVAVLATTIYIEQGVWPSWVGLMPLLNVATLTELRPAQGEECFIIRSMRRMTIHAVLADRRMLPKERTPLVLMAAVALIVDRVSADEFLGLGSVRVVTDGALQLKRAAFVPKQVP